MASLIYLASPYSHTSPAVREHRYLQARRATIDQLLKGVAIFSPIVYGKEMESQLGTHFEAWAALNDTMIHVCTEFWVLTISGWSDSRGVMHEINLAHALNKPVSYINLAGEQVNATD